MSDERLYRYYSPDTVDAKIAIIETALKVYKETTDERKFAETLLENDLGQELFSTLLGTVLYKLDMKTTEVDLQEMLSSSDPIQRTLAVLLKELREVQEDDLSTR